MLCLSQQPREEEGEAPGFNFLMELLRGDHWGTNLGWQQRAAGGATTFQWHLQATLGNLKKPEATLSNLRQPQTTSRILLLLKKFKIFQANCNVVVGSQPAAPADLGMTELLAPTVLANLWHASKCPPIKPTTNLAKLGQKFPRKSVSFILPSLVNKTPGELTDNFMEGNNRFVYFVFLLNLFLQICQQNLKNKSSFSLYNKRCLICCSPPSLVEVTYILQIPISNYISILYVFTERERLDVIIFYSPYLPIKLPYSNKYEMVLFFILWYFCIFLFVQCWIKKPI